MVTIIIMSLILALLQIWIIPMTGALVINIKSMSYLLSNRDKEIRIDPASVSARILRASIKPSRKLACISHARNPFNHYKCGQYNVCDDLGLPEVSLSLGLRSRNLIHPHSGMAGLYCLFDFNGSCSDLALNFSEF